VNIPYNYFSENRSSNSSHSQMQCQKLEILNFRKRAVFWDFKNHLPRSVTSVPLGQHIRLFEFIFQHERVWVSNFAKMANKIRRIHTLWWRLESARQRRIVESIPQSGPLNFDGFRSNKLIGKISRDLIYIFAFPSLSDCQQMGYCSDWTDDILPESHCQHRNCWIC
jgi:hypothetical protein